MILYSLKSVWFPVDLKTFLICKNLKNLSIYRDAHCWGAGAGSRDFLQEAGARASQKL